jgi:hypothetical protein
LGATPGSRSTSTSRGTPSSRVTCRNEEVLVIPPTDENLQTFDLRQYAQEQSLWRFDVFFDFTFTNMRTDSGIDFLHRIVDGRRKILEASALRPR